MQGSGSGRRQEEEEGYAAHRVATVPDLPAAPQRPRPPSTKAGQVKSVTEEPPRSPSKHQPSWTGWCKSWEMSLEMVCAVVHETHRDPFLSWHRIRTPESSTGCSGSPAPTARLDRASRSGLGVRKMELGEKGSMKGGREEITSQL